MKTKNLNKLVFEVLLIGEDEKILTKSQNRKILKSLAGINLAKRRMGWILEVSFGLGQIELCENESKITYIKVPELYRARSPESKPAIDALIAVVDSLCEGERDVNCRFADFCISKAEATLSTRSEIARWHFSCRNCPHRNKPETRIQFHLAHF